jgi:beta-glucanase (GH16 family)
MAAALLFAFALCASRAADVPAWKLVWSDEFDLADGTAPVSTNWVFDIGGGGWGNSELESYTSRRTNSWIEGGALVIQALKENYTGADGIARSYTSARLKSQGKQSWTYGRIEARMKIPRGQGLWPAFWALGSNIGSVGWPTSGEIDIMENIGREPSTAHGTLHGPGYSGGNGIGGLTNLVGKSLADDFHIYAIEWETNRIRWFFDNIQYFSVTSANIPAGTTWVFDQPQFILLNVAVGGSWPGNPDSTTAFPQRMTVDYVRVYTRTNTPAASLQIEASGNALRASWPGEFPHVRLQRVASLGQIWQDQSLTGARQNDRFTEPINSGFYRLRWQ